MKAIFKLILVTAVYMIVASGLYAQKNIRTKDPRWISDKGFWQIESNINTPDKNIVYFYNKENTLIYKEHLDGVVLNLAKKRVKMRLKKALETAIHAWNRDRTLQNDQQLISVLFKNEDF
ncbi:MAG: hypothetical protein H7122_02115 [Chitinophagaceae bacterium]|nr:hypothetical protein [Chitinophagaceae bacterium]